MTAPLLHPSLTPLSAQGRFWALVPCAGVGSRAVPAGAGFAAQAQPVQASTVAAFSPAAALSASAPTAPLPKQYHLVAGHPMVLHTLAAFAGVGRLLGTLVAVGDHNDGCPFAVQAQQ